VSPLDSIPSFEPETLVGATLDGRYLLGAHLATGGMGAVFRATHLYMRKEVAIKVLRPDLTASGEIVERFRREAEIAASLDHPNIVRVSDFGRSPEGYLFLVMELLEGESLFDRVRREGSLPPEQAVPILVDVCHALEAAHARCVVHRDLKPENVFLARTSDGGERTRILDFGIAKIADAANVSTTQAGMVVGTPEYLAPEQALGAAVDARADLYAVGLMAWRALVGRHPFKANDARALLMMQATRPVPSIVEARPELAEYPALAAAIACACAKDPADRPASAAMLAAALADGLGPSYVPIAVATPAPPHTPAPRPSSRFAPFLPGIEIEDRATTDALGDAFGDAPARETPGPRTPAPAVEPSPASPRPRPRPARLGAHVTRAAARLSPRSRLTAGGVTALVLAVAAAGGLGFRRERPAAGAAATPGAGARATPALVSTVVPAVASPAPAPAASGATLRLPKLVADLADRRCAVRRAAARRLGELGDPAALPKLRALAAATRDAGGFHGLGQPEPACGAPEAAQAVRRIESGRRAAKGRRPQGGKVP
jgi:serine/threonine protein kinase